MMTSRTTSRMTKKAAMQARLSIMPVELHDEYRQAMKGKDPHAAIRSMCAECVGWWPDGAAGCDDVGCPLHPYRNQDQQADTGR